MYADQQKKRLSTPALMDIVEDLMAWIAVASADIAITPDLFKRIRQFFAHRFRLCYDLRGRHFEQFLL
ncbi:hypothetical protein TNCV_1703511 [Trichonephila clavipes]|nr:hypothetical protein TNCV_1703511 [Trichonephila clavipes]